MTKILWLSFAGLFLVSAALQFNDPDPLYWSVAYAAAALACVRFAMRSGPRTLVWVALGIVLQLSRRFDSLDVDAASELNG